jgi:thioredoxin 1
MGSAKELTSESFDSEVSNGVTLVDFWSEGCMPCKLMAPVIDEVADEFEGKATVGKLNVVQAMDVGQKFGIQVVPTIIIFKDGKEEQKFEGRKSKDELVSALNAALS